MYSCLMECVWCLCPLLTKLLPSQQILIKVSNIKHHKTVSSGSSACTSKHMARKKIRYDKANLKLIKIIQKGQKFYVLA